MKKDEPGKGQRGDADPAGGLAGLAGLGGLIGGLGDLLGKLGELAEKGQVLRTGGDLGAEGDKIRGVYGFTIRTAAGKEPGVKVEPFGNVRRDSRTGQTVVHETREPVVDVFEEADHLLVVAEMPGVSEADIRLSLAGNLLTLEATRGERKYRKEVLLPATPAADALASAPPFTCRNGMLELRLPR